MVTTKTPLYTQQWWKKLDKKISPNLKLWDFLSIMLEIYINHYTPQAELMQSIQRVTQVVTISQYHQLTVQRTFILFGIQ
jgi:hypothetical protein